MIIGSDETLKGDTFGGIVVAAVKCVDESIVTRDSKLLSDHQILRIAPLIEKGAQVCVKSIYPKEYNQMFSNLNSMTKILDVLHSSCAQSLSPGHHIVDEYPGCGVGDEQVVRAESQYREVAAASIVARYYALKQIAELSKLAGFKIPLGSTHVKDALKEIKELNLDFSSFVKVHFGNVKPFL